VVDQERPSPFFNGQPEVVEPLLTAANLLYVLAYFVRSTLQLRMLSLGGTSCLIGYFLTLPEPLLKPVYWNALYVVINAVWIGRLLLQSSRTEEA
jgi:hypothetical protein